MLEADSRDVGMLFSNLKLAEVCSFAALSALLSTHLDLPVLCCVRRIAFCRRPL